MSTDIHPCRADELERLIPLLDEEFIFGKGRSISLRQRFPTVFCLNNLHNIIVCTDGEQIVSALAMRQFDWREGDEIFKGAMLGAVYTHPARRGEGWASRLLGTAAMQLRESGVDFGVLWTGQPSFYARLGWEAADCSILAEVEPEELILPPTGKVAHLSVGECSAPLEKVRQRCLNSMTLRRPEDYRQMPLPAENMDVLWCEDEGRVAYALRGRKEDTGFLYELVGDEACFSALWREACRGYRQVYVNDRADSPSSRWLTNHAGITWKRKNLAMWLPLSKRLDMSRLRQWYVPYFDRI